MSDLARVDVVLAALHLGGQAIDPPTFAAIAKDPAKTPEYLRNFFASPHKDMPPIQLTPLHIEDIIAYLGTMKKR